MKQSGRILKGVRDLILTRSHFLDVDENLFGSFLTLEERNG